MLARKLSGAAAAARPQPTFVSSSISRVSANATNTVTAPSGIQNGDLLVAVGMANINGRSITPPTGFNVFHLDGATSNTLFIATKTASSESGNYSFVWSASDSSTIAILVYRNALCVNTVGTAAKSTTATPSASTITPTYVGTLCAAFFTETTATVTTPPSGMTQRAIHTASSPSAAIYDLANQSASATGGKSIQWSGSAASTSILFQVTNEPAIAPEFIASAFTQDSAASTTLSISKPTGVTAGDLLIAFMASDQVNTWSGDTDWTEVADQGTAKPSVRIVYKTAGSSEPTAYTFTCSTTVPSKSGCILAYRYAAFDAVAGAFSTAAAILSLNSVTTTLSQSTLLAIGAAASNLVSITTPLSMSSRMLDTDAFSPSFRVCDQRVAKGPSTPRVIDVGTASDVAGIMLAIKPTRSL